MYKYEVKDFAKYEVYEYVNGKKHTLFICNEYDIAKNLARTLARMDPVCDTYYLTGIHNPGDFIPGGGWYECWHWDNEKGCLITGSLS